jgi:hypothetical protein
MRLLLLLAAFAAGNRGHAVDLPWSGTWASPTTPPCRSAGQTHAFFPIPVDVASALVVRISLSWLYVVGHSGILAVREGKDASRATGVHSSCL